MGQKRGATPSPRQSVLPLYVAKQCQRCKNVTLCQRVTETPCHIPTVDFYFYVYFCSTIATQDSICAASQPVFGLHCAFFKADQWFYILVHVCFKTWAYICSIFYRFMVYYVSHDSMNLWTSIQSIFYLNHGQLCRPCFVFFMDLYINPQNGQIMDLYIYPLFLLTRLLAQLNFLSSAFFLLFYLYF